MQCIRGTLCRGTPGIWDMTNRRAFQVLKYNDTSPFLPSLTSLYQPGEQQRFLNKKGRECGRKRGFSAVLLYENQPLDLPHVSRDIFSAPSATPDANAPNHVNIHNTALKNEKKKRKRKNSWRKSNMLLPGKTREYTFPSAEQDHPLYISIYSTDCLCIPHLPRQDRQPASVSSPASTREAPLCPWVCSPETARCRHSFRDNFLGKGRSQLSIALRQQPI